jgi:hypothetical protein
MEYTSLSHDDLAPVNGYILQGPVSDRDAIALEMGAGELEKSILAAKVITAGGRGHESMPLEYLPASFQRTPISAARWYALGAVEYVSPKKSQGHSA